MRLLDDLERREFVGSETLERRIALERPGLTMTDATINREVVDAAKRHIG